VGRVGGGWRVEGGRREEEGRGRGEDEIPFKAYFFMVFKTSCSATHLLCP
jgi:hypothetical protein